MLARIEAVHRHPGRRTVRPGMTGRALQRHARLREVPDGGRRPLMDEEPGVDVARCAGATVELPGGRASQRPVGRATRGGDVTIGASPPVHGAAIDGVRLIMTIIASTVGGRQDKAAGDMVGCGVT